MKKSPLNSSTAADAFRSIETASFFVHQMYGEQKIDGGVDDLFSPVVSFV
jgi:hypothetical protein